MFQQPGQVPSSESRMTVAEVIEMSVNVTTYQDDHTSLSYDMTPGFNPFTIVKIFLHNMLRKTTDG